MSALEVLQTCPSQTKALLYALGVNGDDSSTMIKFETIGHQPRLPYYVSLLVHVEFLNMIVKHTVIDEGAATSMMSLSCYKGLGSPELSKLATMLTAFDGRSFRPHDIIPSLKVHLGGKTVAIEVEWWLMRPLTTISCWVGTRCTVCKPLLLPYFVLYSFHIMGR